LDFNQLISLPYSNPVSELSPPSPPALFSAKSLTLIIKKLGKEWFWGRRGWVVNSETGFNS